MHFQTNKRYENKIMALQRNGFHKKDNNNNSNDTGNNGSGIPGFVYKGQKRDISEWKLNQLQGEDNRLIEWFDNISKKERFSREWILTCLTELTLQCMGKIPHVLGDMHVYSFLPNSARNSLKLMAEIQGYNIFKLNKELGTVLPAVMDGVSPQEQISNDEPKQITLRNDEEIIAETASILVNVGAFKDKDVIDVTPK